MEQNNLIELERAGWRALSSGGDEAEAFYDRVLDEEALMLLPGGMVLDDRDTILRSMSGQPWASFELEEASVLTPTADITVVAYGVVARREGASEYSALVSSTYIRRADGWKLAFHQQTPR